MNSDFISGFLTGYINTILYYPAYTITHHKFHNNQKLSSIFENIYKNNGIKGFYSGLSLFSLYIPLIRGGEMFFQKKCNNLTSNPTLNIAIATLYSNVWRFSIYPINTLQINKQVLHNYHIFKSNQISLLWNGFTYNLYSGILSNFLWFYIYHQINKGFDNNNLCKSSMAGASASIVSDTVTHPFKVFKLLKQTNTDFIFNFKTAYRGYFIRILINGFQGASYGFLWNIFDNFFHK